MNMKSDEIKQKIMKLWKETFHDSDAYISLVFDTYFNPELVEYYEEKDQVISALLGIPYEFNNGNEKFSGIYLCGLATKENFRHRGIMAGLINKINESARDKGYAISFLIPASDALRIYYQNKGYVNAMYRVEECYTNVHDFSKDYMASLRKEDERVIQYRQKYLNELIATKFVDNKQFNIDKISYYIHAKEQESKNYINIVHSNKDIEAIIRENQLSNGEIYYVRTSDNILKGIAFVTFDERKKVIIPKIFFDDSYAYYKLLDEIKKSHSESPISIFRYPEEVDRFALWDKVYGAPNPNGFASGSYGVTERVYDVGNHSQSYGMIKILDISQILKFMVKDRTDLKFSILVKEDNFAKEGTLYNVEADRVISKKINDTQIHIYNRMKDVTILSYRDISEILFRKKDQNSLIMEAFGIPRIGINMSLMLD